MRTKLFLTGAGLVAWAVMLGVTFWAGRQTKAMLAEIETLRVADGLVRARLVQAEEELARMQKTGTHEGLSAGGNERVVSLLRSEAHERSKARVRERQDNDPQFQMLYAASEADGYVTLHLPFFRAMGLSTGQIERLRAAHLRSRLVRLDLAAIRRRDELSRRDPVIAVQEKQAADAERSVEEEILGRAGLEQRELWRRSLPVHHVVRQFAGMTSLLGETITADQAEQLIAILAESDPGFRKNGGVAYDRINWGAASRAARSILSPAQQELFAVEAEAKRALAEQAQALAVARREEAKQRIEQ